VALHPVSPLCLPLILDCADAMPVGDRGLQTHPAILLVPPLKKSGEKKKQKN